MAIRIAVAIVVLAIVGLFGWVFFLNPEALNALRQWAGDTAPVEEPEPNGLFAEEEDTYSVRVQYPPRTALVSVEANARAQAAMEQGIGEAINEFKQLADPTLMTPEELAWATERPYALDITHQEYTASGTVSYVYQIYSDTGGAHPNAFYRTFTFNESGEELMLEDVFVEDAPYLERVSEKVYAGVLAQLEEKSGAPVEGEAQETVRLGTAPTPEALQFFYLTGNALHVIIPPYQAAAWAAGSFDVAIPLTELADILK
jgi:hypothetical protein